MIELAPPLQQKEFKNLEAEQCLLGALLLNNSSLEYVSDFLRADHFAHTVHGLIYESIQLLIDRGQIADPITLKDIFKENEHLAAVGGAGYLVDLVNSVVSMGATADYGQLIYDLYLKRQLINFGYETVQEVHRVDVEKTGVQLIGSTEKRLYDLATKESSIGNVITLKDALAQSIKSIEIARKRDSHIVGVTTGFIDLDKRLGGLRNSDLLILAGRPAMGKTALATNIAFNAAFSFFKNPIEGAPVAFFSLEMSAEQLATRILSSESKMSSSSLRQARINEGDFINLVGVSKSLYPVPLFIDDTPGLTVMSLRNRARRLKRQYDIGLIVIDYLQLLESGNRRSGDNRVQEISEITRSLKGIARELNVPVLVLSQLSRAVEQREDKRPQLSDLRESGSIEQDADVVMFVYREEYYEERRQPPENSFKHLDWQKKMDAIYRKAELIIAKHRHGPCGTVKLFFNHDLTKFETPVNF